jgi:hypothetical protein
MESLGDQLVGAWKLVLCVEVPMAGSVQFNPMSEQPLGIIMHMPGGYMPAQLMHPNRKNFVSADWFDDTDAEYKQEASTYIAYTGPFDGMKKSKHLHIFFSFHCSQTQPRVVRVEGDLLHLGTASPIMSGGEKINPKLLLKRTQRQIQ